MSYIISGRHPKFGGRMHLRMADCPITFSGRCDLDLSDLVSRIDIDSGAYLL